MKKIEPKELFTIVTGMDVSVERVNYTKDNPCGWVFVDRDEVEEIETVDVWEKEYPEDEYAERSNLIETDNGYYSANIYYDLGWTNPTGDELFLDDDGNIVIKGGNHTYFIKRK